MTYCIGWKYENGVYLIGDSAVKKIGNPTQEVTSVGEKVYAESRGDKNIVVEESAYKIFPISNDCAVACAGNAKLAKEIIRTLKGLYSSEADISQLFFKVCQSHGPFNEEEAVQFIIAKNFDKKAELLQWSSFKFNELPVDSEFHQIGSLKSFERDLTPNVIKTYNNGKPSNAKILPIIVSILQSYGIHSYLMDQGVGGIFWGLEITSSGIQWLDDTSFVIYEKSGTGITADIVSTFADNNVLAVHSTSTNSTKVLISSETTFPHQKSDYQRIANIFNEKLLSSIAKYWVFIRKSERKIFVVELSSGKKDCKYFRIDSIEPGFFKLVTSKEFNELLLAPWGISNENYFPFKLGWHSE